MRLELSTYGLDEEQSQIGMVDTRHRAARVEQVAEASFGLQKHAQVDGCDRVDRSSAR